MNFFGNNCGCGGYNEGYNSCGGGCGIDPCTLILVLLLSGGNRGGCGCGIDCCSLLLIMLLLSCCGGGNKCCKDYDGCQ